MSQRLEATLLLEVSDEEPASPGSSSPWNGWVGWLDEEVTVAWRNAEVGSQGATSVPLEFDIDAEPTDEQWARLAQLVAASCFGASEPS